MVSIRKSLLQFVFAGSYMKRWNDKLRPMELLEVDKQAHKMIVAWLLYQQNSRAMDAETRLALGNQIIEGGIFDYFYRLVITDIKPPVFYRIKDNPQHYEQLSSWVLDELEPLVQPLGDPFWSRMQAWVRRRHKESLADDILEAAHLFASNWEFQLIKGLNTFDDEMEDIADSFTTKLAGFSHLEGMDSLRTGTGALGKFAVLCGQLRFQKRWSQTPRIPETSVLGHMFLVACYSYFFSLAVGACRARRQNNFFIGLFHDLPELLTRDIISPVKKSVEELDAVIKEYEEAELRRKVLNPLIAEGYEVLSERLSYYLGLEVGSEFSEAVIEDGAVRKVDFEALQDEYNNDMYDPRDGSMLKTCDTLAAFIEAYTAVRNGISSDQLQAALWRLRERNRRTIIGPVHVGALFADFD